MNLTQTETVMIVNMIQKKIKNVKIPKLIIHSENDEIIPFHHGEKLFKAALSPKQFYKMHGGHNDGFIVMGNEYKDAIRNFIKENLK